MKKVLIAAVMATAITAGAAAPADAADFTVSGSVTPTCNYTGGTIPFGTIGVNSDGTIASGQSASSTAQTGFFCNGAGTTLGLSHAAMTDGVTAPSGFTSTIDFTPAVKVGGTDKQVGDGTGTSFGAIAGSLVVDARTLTATGKLTAGTYNGSVTLTLTPAL
jgi:hypothetical protein